MKCEIENGISPEVKAVEMSNQDNKIFGVMNNKKTVIFLKVKGPARLLTPYLLTH
jgi:hypothetical protein